jgi:hypothetical protein
MSLSLTVRQGLFLAEDVSAVARITKPQFVKTAPAGAAFDRDLAFDSTVA